MRKSFKEKTNKSFKGIETLQQTDDYTLDLYRNLSIILEWVALAIVILLGTYLLNNNMMQLNTFITLFMYKKMYLLFQNL